MSKIDVAFIIDDDQIFVYGLKKMITVQNLCKTLMVFNNGEEAMNYIRPMLVHNDHLPDLILLDINMPIMDGWDFLDEFVKINPLIKKEITIYMISSSINPSDIERAKGYSEISKYLVKPITLDEISKLFHN